MKFSLNWLSRHVSLEGLSTEEIDRLLTFAGVEVEEITRSGIDDDHFVVARILSFEKHPNADRLRLCQVDDGSGTPRQIVCGATNFAVGDLVPLALPGATMPAGFKIKSGKLRGVVSDGMLCAGEELGIPDSADGLLILSADAPVGKPLSQHLPPDVIFQLEITPNRPDLLSHQGLARELATLTGRELKDMTQPAAERSFATGGVRIDDAVGCPFYTARVIRGVKVGPSPKWLSDALLSVGLRPINHLVDITNFLLHDVGQPLHVFDLDRLKGDVVVRSAQEGETFTALDQKTYKLTPEDLVIADDKGPVALAGVMGGLDSSVTESTTNVLLESAWFQPSRVRHTSRKLGLMSDSSYRFERIADASLTVAVSDLATSMIEEMSGGTADKDAIAVGAAPIETPEITLEGDHVRRLLGSPTEDATIDTILQRLGVEKIDASTWRAPAFRPDLRRHVDLIEEVARVQGLDPVPSQVRSCMTAPSPADLGWDRLREIRQRFAAAGLREARTLKLLSPALANQSLWMDDEPAEPVGMKNPLGEDHSLLRPSLVPGLLQVAAHNFRNGADHAAFFETGSVFLPCGELLYAAALLSGPASEESWQETKPRPYDWHDLTGLLNSVFGSGKLTVRPARRPSFAPAAEVLLNSVRVGVAGQLIPSRTKSLVDTKHAIFVLELDLEPLLATSPTTKKAEQPPKFPGVTRDVAMEAPRDLAHEDLAKFFASRKQSLLVGRRMFDLFTDDSGDKLPANRKSIAYRLYYQAPDRTLESQEVDAAHKEILADLVRDLPVTIR